MSVGLIHRDVSVCGGAELVAILMLKCLRRSGFRTILLSGKKFDENSIMRNFGINIQINRELVFPIWTRNVETYFAFMLPSIIKPLCDTLINTYTNDLLPWVDVTYIHYPRPSLLKQKAHKQKFWHYYYKLYQSVEHMLSFRASRKLVLANSFFTAEAVRKKLGISPTVIYPPVDIEKINNLKSDAAKTNLVVTISRFSSEKNLEQVPLVARDVDANFAILGSIHNTTSYYRIQRLIKKYGIEDKVTVIVDAPLSTKIELLRRAKVYFHTTHSEHFGISIVEGMAAGCIPVVHDSGGPMEYVPCRWRYRDTEDAVQKIREALDSWSSSVAVDMRDIAYKFRTKRFQMEFLTTLRSFLKRKNESA